MARPIDYSKWDKFVDSDDENDSVQNDHSNDRHDMDDENEVGSPQQDANPAVDDTSDDLAVKSLTLSSDKVAEDDRAKEYQLDCKTADVKVLRDYPALAAVGWEDMATFWEHFRRLAALGYMEDLTFERLVRYVISEKSESLADEQRATEFEDDELFVKFDWDGGSVFWCLPGDSRKSVITVDDLPPLVVHQDWKGVVDQLCLHPGTQPLQTAGKSTIQVLIDYLTRLASGDTNAHLLFVAMENAAMDHYDFTIYGDDLPIHRPPTNPKIAFNATSCIYSALLVGTVAAPANPDTINELYKSQLNVRLFKWGYANTQKSRNMDLIATIREVRKEMAGAAGDELCVLLVSILDVDENFEEVPARNLELNLSHNFAIALSPQGVAVFSSYTFIKFQYSFKQWFDRGHGRVRTWKEFEKWIEAFEIIKEPATVWSPKLNQAWEQCFDINLLKEMRPESDGTRNITGAWNPLVRVFKLPNVTRKDLGKFEWKLKEYRHELGWKEDEEEGDEEEAPDTPKYVMRGSDGSVVLSGSSRYWYRGIFTSMAGGY